MGRPTGFQEYQRHPDGTVKPLKRILNYDEFHTALDPEQRRIQAARCMDCGVPFCQAGCGYGTGTMGGGTPGGGPVSGCPLHNLIP
ncbi:MAG: hypothetical protein HUJ69_02735, partial [Lachnospiraceae bacterium]|nr:hypothetical protein [Lachnospiraceae bacterium]